MGAPYQSQAISGFNASPPPDDATTVPGNKITWNSTIKAKLADPLNTFIAAVNSQLVTWSDFSSVTTSTNLTTNTSHHMQTIEVTSGSPTIQLGDAATMTKNYVVTVTNTGTGAPVIALATALNTLDGTANGTFTFPTGTKTSFTFKVNNGATGYYTEVVGGKTILAQTSVVTPLVSSTGNLVLNAASGASTVIQVNGVNQAFADGTNFNPGTTLTQGLGASGTRWANLFTATVDLNTATGGQIAFPATQNPSAGANTLDDYEEGTWVPSVGGSATYTTQTGTYTKIGRQVFVAAEIAINAIGSGSTTNVSGLPFTSTSQNHVLSVRVVSGSATSIVSSYGDIAPSATVVNILSRTAASAADGLNAIFANSAQVFITGVYQTT